MKKRAISTLLCATMLVGMITGCGSNNTESAGNTSSNAASTESGDGDGSLTVEYQEKYLQVL